MEVKKGIGEGENPGTNIFVDLHFYKDFHREMYQPIHTGLRINIYELTSNEQYPKSLLFSEDVHQDREALRQPLDFQLFQQLLVINMIFVNKHITVGITVFSVAHTLYSQIF